MLLLVVVVGYAFWCAFFLNDFNGINLLLGSFELGVVSIASLNVGKVPEVPPGSTTGSTESEGDGDVLNDLLTEFTSDGSNHF